MRSFWVQIIAVIGKLLELPQFRLKLFGRLPLSTAIIVGAITLALPAQSQVRWKTPPTGAEIPERALEEGVSGEATIVCSGTPTGTVDNCRIENERPEGFGFGQAAVQFIQSGTLEPSLDGLPIAAFRIRVPFKVEDVAPTQIAEPSWRIPPRVTVDDFPRRTLNAGASGAAVVRCTASAEGVPQNCEVLQERPERLGFGEAAVKIMQRGRLNVDGTWLPGASFIVAIPFSIY